MQMAKLQVSLHKIDHIFISHLHGDHYLGLMPLLFSMHLHKRSNDLYLYSPNGLDEIITLQLKHSKSALNYKLIFHPLNPSKIQTFFNLDAITLYSLHFI